MLLEIKFPTHFPVLRTQRLILRELASSDADCLYKILSDDSVTKHYDLPTFTQKSQAITQLETWKNLFTKKKGIRWAIIMKENNSMIGTCGFCKIHKKWSSGEIGYVVAREYWNKGYTSESVSAMLKLGFEVIEFNRIEAWTMKGNHASDRVLEKNGFQKEGVLRESQVWNGEVRDIVMFGMLKKEYSKISG